LLDLYKQLIARQYEAALCTLGMCIDRCPDERWHEPVANLKFCQAAFHALFFTDLYLGTSVAAIREQPFHCQHAAIFADYEELEPRRQVLTYEKPFIRDYLQHCRTKAANVLAAETTESLAGPAGVEWIKFSRAELHVYNIRHVQHHAAQLILRLRLDTGAEFPWIGSSWKLT
jgi:hypothetical protein